MAATTRRMIASVVQAGSEPFDTPATLDKLAALAAQARPRRRS